MGINIRETLGTRLTPCSATSARRSSETGFRFPGLTSSTGSLFKVTGPCRSCATCSKCSTTAAWAAPGTCRSCRSTKGSNIRRPRASRRTRRTSTRRSLPSWRLQPTAVRSPRRSGPRHHRSSYAHKIPLIVKLNHNELLTYPNRGDQVPFASVRQAVDLGAMGVGATIYFGSEEATRQIREVSALFAEAHGYGLFTVLWCYLRNPAFKTPEADYAWRQTSRGRRTTSESRSKPTSSSRSSRRTTAATPR